MVAHLSAEIVKAMQTPEVREHFISIGLGPGRRLPIKLDSTSNGELVPVPLSPANRGRGEKFKYCCISKEHIEGNHIDLIAFLRSIDCVLA